jgi:protein TonB
LETQDYPGGDTVETKVKKTRDKLKRRLTGKTFRYTFMFSVTLHFGVWALLGWRTGPAPGRTAAGPERKSEPIPAVWPYEKLPPPPSVEPAASPRTPDGVSGEDRVGEIPMPVPDKYAEANTIPDAHNRYVNELTGPPGRIIVGNPGRTETGPVSASPEYVEFVPTTKAPTLIYQSRPKYPDIARDSRVEGDVVLLVYIDERGEVRNVTVQSSPGLPALDEAAKEAAYKCKFKPAEQQGIPVGVWYSLVMQFEL